MVVSSEWHSAASHSHAEFSIKLASAVDWFTLYCK